MLDGNKTEIRASGILVNSSSGLTCLALIVTGFVPWTAWPSSSSAGPTGRATAATASPARWTLSQPPARLVRACLRNAEVLGRAGGNDAGPREVCPLLTSPGDCTGHTPRLGYEYERVAVLRHALLNLVAFVELPRDHVEPPLAFIDRLRLAQILSETGFQVLTTAELSQPITSADLSGLTAQEHEQVRYWKPATVGELLFNYWD